MYYIYKYINYVIYSIIYNIWYKRNEFIEVTGFFSFILKYVYNNIPKRRET